MAKLQPHHYAIKGLPKKIILSSFLYTLAALLIISAASTYPFFLGLKSYTENNLIQAAKIRALAVEEYLSRTVEITRQITSRSAAKRALADYAAGRLTLSELIGFSTPILNDALNISDEVMGITRLDKQGQILVNLGHSVPETFIPGLIGDRSITMFDPISIDGNLFLLVSAPILSKEDELLGFDVVVFTTGNLQRIIWDDSGMGRSGESFLTRLVDNEVLFFFPGRRGLQEIYNHRVPNSPYLSATDEAARGHIGLKHLNSIEHKSKITIAHAPVPGTQWALLVTIDQSELMSPLRKQIVSVAGLALFLTIIGALGMLALLRPMTGRVLVYSEELITLNRDLQQEIYERRQVENRLRRSEHEWEQTFEAITDALAIVDRQGRVVKMNRATLEIAREVAPDKPPEYGCRLLFGMESKSGNCPFCRMMQTGEGQSAEFHEPTIDRWFYISSYPLRDDDGNLWGGVLIAHDFTEQRRMEQLKDEMISSVSHEMRTPLTAMLGFVEFLLENPVERELQIDYLQTVHRETERLNELISNFLDLQRLQAQVGSYRFATIDICSLLREAAHLFQVASKKHEIHIQCPEALPKVRADDKRLLQVLKNLLSNAIKYSPKGGEIVLSARSEEEQIIISVSDQGMGIPSHARERIFERFYRVDDSEKRIPGGIGLGLSLVREVIRAHGGEVWVDSEMGKGSTFYFSLPVAGKVMNNE